MVTSPGVCPLVTCTRFPPAQGPSHLLFPLSPFSPQELLLQEAFSRPQARLRPRLDSTLLLGTDRIAFYLLLYPILANGVDVNNSLYELSVHGS